MGRGGAARRADERNSSIAPAFLGSAELPRADRKIITATLGILLTSLYTHPLSASLSFITVQYCTVFATVLRSETAILERTYNATGSFSAYTHAHKHSPAASGTPTPNSMIRSVMWYKLRHQHVLGPVYTAPHLRMTKLYNSGGEDQFYAS